MNICFYGVGGVGGYFGSLFASQLLYGNSIFFVARGKHLEAIQKNGLILKSANNLEPILVRPDICTDSVGNLPLCDLIILSVKSYDLPNAAKDIAKITHDGTLILPLLNGVDIYERIREHLNIGTVLQACVYVGTHIEAPGVIYQKGGSCKIYVGNDPLHPNIWAETLLEILNEAHINYEWTDNIEVEIWSKFMFIAAFGLVTATYSKTLGEILENSDLCALVKAIMGEIESIARKQQIQLNADIVENTFQNAKQFPFETKTSFQRDIEAKGKTNEGDLFGGTLLHLGENMEIPTPFIYKVQRELIERIELSN